MSWKLYKIKTYTTLLCMHHGFHKNIKISTLKKRSTFNWKCLRLFIFQVNWSYLVIHCIMELEFNTSVFIQCEHCWKTWHNKLTLFFDTCASFIKKQLKLFYFSFSLNFYRYSKKFFSKLNIRLRSK